MGTRVVGPRRGDKRGGWLVVVACGGVVMTVGVMSE